MRKYGPDAFLETLPAKSVLWHILCSDPHAFDCAIRGVYQYIYHKPQAAKILKQSIENYISIWQGAKIIILGAHVKVTLARLEPLPGQLETDLVQFRNVQERLFREESDAMESLANQIDNLSMSRRVRFAI